MLADPRFRTQVLLQLPAAIASAQLTLIGRSGSGPGNFLVIQLLVWFCAGVLWLEAIEVQPIPVWGRRAPLALLPLLWVLLVLSRPTTLYDPLLNAIPLATLLALALLVQRPPEPAWLALGLLPLLHYAVINLTPNTWLAHITAAYSGFLLWLGGFTVVTQGVDLQLGARSVIVGPGCTGLNVISLSFASVLALLLLNGWLSWRRTLVLLLSAPWIAFLVNGIRVALLCLTPPTPPPGPLGEAISFEFWHRGPGSTLFSLVVVLVLFQVEHQLRELSSR